MYTEKNLSDSGVFSSSGFAVLQAYRKPSQHEMPQSAMPSKTSASGNIRCQDAIGGDAGEGGASGSGGVAGGCGGVNGGARACGGLLRLALACVALVGLFKLCGLSIQPNACM